MVEKRRDWVEKSSSVINSGVDVETVLTAVIFYLRHKQLFLTFPAQSVWKSLQTISSTKKY